MKILKFIPLLLLFVLASCSSVRVNSDYDKNASFDGYKTYAYHKSGIDKVEISDLDKRRILRSIDEAMAAKGFTKSDANPDLLINFFTKERTNHLFDSLLNDTETSQNFNCLRLVLKNLVKNLNDILNQLWSMRIFSV